MALATMALRADVGNDAAARGYASHPGIAFGDGFEGRDVGREAGGEDWDGRTRTSKKGDFT